MGVRCRVAVASFLLLSPAVPALASERGAIASQAQARNADGVRALLKAGADVNEPQGDGMTALHWAALHGDAMLTRALLAAGASSRSATRINAYTPLMLAAESGERVTLDLLLKAGADPNAFSATGSTALMLAAGAGHPDAVTALVRAGADVNAKERRRGLTAVMYAATGGHADVIAALAARGADLSATTSVLDVSGRAQPDGRPSAILPGRDRAYTYPELIGSLGGLTALLLAARDGHTAAAQALITAGADLNQGGSGHGTTPLLIALINGHFDLAQVLLAAGADPRLASDNGVEPLYAVVNTRWAQKTFHNQLRDRLQQESDYLQVMVALLDKGADPNARLGRKVWYSEFNKDQSSMNETGATPFWRAAYACDVDAMRLLVNRGADPAIPTIRPADDRRGYAPAESSAMPPVPVGGPSVTPLIAAAGVGHGRGGGSSRHLHLAGCMPAVRYLVDELRADVNAQDHGGNTSLHYAAARGDNEMIRYLVAKGASLRRVNRAGQTIADLANGPTERGVPPFPETLALLASLGVAPNNPCVICK